MIDLRKSIFKSDINNNVSTVQQNLHINYTNYLIKIINEKSGYDNLSKASAFYNLKWIKSNINLAAGDLSNKQHKSYLLHIIEKALAIN